MKHSINTVITREDEFLSRALERLITIESDEYFNASIDIDPAGGAFLQLNPAFLNSIVHAVVYSTVMGTLRITAHQYEPDAGTVQVNGTAVAGTGTAFVDYSVGDLVFIDSREWVKIAAIADNTNLTIENAPTLLSPGVDYPFRGYHNTALPVTMEGKAFAFFDAPISKLEFQNLEAKRGVVTVYMVGI